MIVHRKTRLPVPGPMMIWAVVLAVAAGVMAGLPLFGVLGFESSFVLAIMVSFAGAQLAALHVSRRRAAATPSDAAAVDARPLGAVLELTGQASLRVLVLLAPPLAILLGNALRVKNCNLSGGLLFFLMLPVLSAVTSSVAGVYAGLLLRRPLPAALAATGVVLASIGWGLARFYTAPPVFGFDPFVGWFPGSLYDEELSISRAFLVARGLHLLGAAAALSLAAAFIDGSPLRVSMTRSAGSLPGRRMLVGVGLLLGCVFLYARGAAQPLIAPDEDSIATALGARRETPHMVLLYSKTGPWAKEIALHAADAEFRYAQLAEALRVEPGRITCYLFDSAAEKQRLLGAAHTQIAKPWRREIYLQYEAFPHPVLKHELAHVFAGAFGDPIFHVSRRGFRFNLGLIEGIAVAVGDRPGRLALHEQVNALRALGMEPKLATIFGPGFLAEAPARAYTTAGSFVRYLLDERGPEPLRAVYREGGSDDGFRAAYGASFEELAAGWSRAVDAAKTSDGDRELVASRARRPGVMHRVCAHELAVRRERARALSAKGDYEGALATFESVCIDEPDDPESLLAVMDSASAAGRTEQAEATARKIVDARGSGDADRARALILLGDNRLRAYRWAPRSPSALLNDEARGALALLDDPPAEPTGTPATPTAATTPTTPTTPKTPTTPTTPTPAPGDATSDPAPYYRRALALSIDEDTARQLRARMIAVEDLELGPALARYLVGEGPVRNSAFDLLRAREVLDADPSEGLGHYLLGRMLYNHDHFDEAAAALDTAGRRGLPPGGFTVAALRLAGLATLRGAGGPAAAEAAFIRYGASAEADAGARREAEDLVARCRFMER